MLALFKSLMLLDNYFSSSKVSLFGISEKKCLESLLSFFQVYQI